METFNNVQAELNSFLAETGVKGRELALVSGCSASMVSRIKTGRGQKDVKYQSLLALRKGMEILRQEQKKVQDAKGQENE